MMLDQLEQIRYYIIFSTSYHVTPHHFQVQLLIRNDTTMGTVILNTLLHENMPVSKSGKNGLLMVVTGEVGVILNDTNIT